MSSEPSEKIYFPGSVNHDETFATRIIALIVFTPLLIILGILLLSEHIPAWPILGGFGVLAPCIILLLWICGLFAPHGYSVTTHGVVVERKIGGKTIAWSRIHAVEHGRPGDFALDVRICGVDGHKGYYGLYANRTLGLYRCCLTRRDRVVILRTNGLPWVLSPDNSEAFLDACAPHIGKEGNMNSPIHDGLAFSATMDHVAVVVTRLVWLVVVLPPLVLYFGATRLSGAAPLPIAIAAGGVTLILALSLMICGLYAPRGYRVTPTGVEIVRRLGNKLLRWDEIRSVELGKPEDFAWAMRVCGVGGYLGYFGLYWSKPLGQHHACLTRRDRLVILRTNALPWVLSPDEPEAFLQACAQHTPKCA